MSPFANVTLLATDRSREAERAARMAVGLTQSLGSELHVINVTPLPSPYALSESTVIDPRYRDEVRRIAEREANEKLEDEVGKIREMGGEVSGSHPGAGRPDAGIVHVAEEIGADLIVLGSRGLGPLRRTLMGSVSTSVVRHAHGSVLVVRGEPRQDGYLSGRVLLAVDGSQESEAASRAAVEITSATGSELHLLFAIRTQERPPYSNPLLGERWASSLEETKHRAREFVDEKARRIESEGVSIKDAHLAFGEPDHEIVKLGEELEAGLIVVGSRGLGGVRRALMGSVSDSVVRHAYGPVLVVRG
jgi:nucleotide-binding universal stress UspA family protein